MRAINIVIQAFPPLLISLVLVHSSCSNRIPLTGCLISNINLFIIILKDRKSKIRVHPYLVSSEGLISDLQVHFIVVTSHDGKELRRSMFYERVHPIHKGSTIMIQRPHFHVLSH